MRREICQQHAALWRPATARAWRRAAWLGLLTLAAQSLPAANALWFSYTNNPNNQANITMTRPHQIIGINAGAKTVTLKEPLRFACRGIWLPELRALAAPLSECGVEQLSVALARNYPWYTSNHTFEAGWNGIKFDSVINGFVRRVEVLDPDGLALILMYSKNITVTDARIRASAANRQRHHYATLMGNSHDCLLENIVVDSFPWHGLAMDQYSSGNAYSRCRLNAQGTLEYHGTLAYQNMRTEITLHNSGLHSGPTGAQPAIGGRTAHWNINGQFSGPLVCVGDPSVLVQGALVGVQNMQVPAVTGAYNVRGYYGQYGANGCAVEDSGLNGMVPAPANLYEAQKALRFGQPIPLGNGGGSTPTGNDTPYTFAFPGAVTGAYLAGQDNWLTPDANRGFGILTNLAHPAGMVMAGAGDPAKESLVARQHDARWHATPFFGSETSATFACDINFASSAGGINVGLMSSSTEDGLLVIAFPNGKWYLRRAIYGTLFATNDNPGPFSADTWLRLTMVFDFSACGGTGAVTVAYTNLTAGGAAVTLPSFTAVPLRGIVRYPWAWDTLVYRSASAAWANVIPNVAATVLPEVTVVATDPAAFIGIYDTATFAVTRTPTANQPLLVHYYIAGQSTARFGADYSNALSGMVTIAASQSQAFVTVTADPGAATNATVVLALQAAPHYVIGSSNYASVLITVPEPAVLTVLIALTLLRRTSATKRKGVNEQNMQHTR